MRRRPQLAAAVLVPLALTLPLAAQVELPDLSGVEPPVRAKLEGLHRAAVQAARDDEAWGRLGMALDAHEIFDQAKVAYLRAAALDPHDFRWAYHLGCLYEVSQPLEALPWLERAIAIDASYAPARVRLGELLERLARPEQAREQYLVARRLDRSNAFAPLGLGRIELAGGRIETALALLEEAYALAPHTRAVVATLAQACYRARQEERARRLASEARGLSRKTYRPDPRRAAIKAEAVDLRSYLARANTLRDVGQLAEARQEIETLLAKAPEMAEAHYAATGIYDRLGEAELAAASAARALELEPDFLDLRPILAGNLLKLHRLEEAEREARKALVTDPRDPNLHLVLALVGAERGRVDMLATHLDRAYALGTPDREMRRIMLALYDDLSASFAEVGLWSEATSGCERALTLARDLGEPGSVVARYQERLAGYRSRRR